MKLPLETLIEMKGVFVRDCFKVTSYRVIHKPVVERTIDYLKACEWKPMEYARYCVWGIRNPRFWKTILVQYHLLRYMREYLYEEGFIELLPPMISPASDPGLRGAKKLKTIYYGVEYDLTSSVIMYKQLSVAIYEKIFYVARNVREEPIDNCNTGRHLSEFTQLDIEYGLASIEDVIDIAEKLLWRVTKKLADKHSDLILGIELRREPVVLKPPFPRITYDEALEIAGKLGYNVKWGKELSFEAEKALAEYYNTPVWIMYYPATSRGFYYLPREDDPRYNQDFNLILPEGYGELIDGGAREYRYDKLLDKIMKLDEPPEKYMWFLELVKQGAIPPSSGWGLGIERLTCFIAGHKHIVYASMYPKIPGLVMTP